MSNIEIREAASAAAKIDVQEFLLDPKAARILDKASMEYLAELVGEERAYELEARRYEASANLLRTREKFEQVAEYIQTNIDRALPYTQGQPGSWNSLGLLQGSGPELDRLAGEFSIYLDNFQRACFDCRLAVLRAQGAE